jgi:putative tryptophan/tyrosine transport system substrate-binding protein
MQRRKFIGLLGGAAAWPLAARAQQGERVRRIGVLMSTAVDDPQDPARLAAFAQGLQELGWSIGRNLRIDYRWGASNPDNTRKYAEELAALAPDVMLASGTIALVAAVNALSSAAGHSDDCRIRTRLRGKRLARDRCPQGYTR